MIAATDIASDFQSIFISLVPAAIVVGLTILGVWLMQRYVERGLKAHHPENRFKRQLGILAVVGVGLLLLLLTIPVDSSTRSSLLSLFGLLLTAVIALSSTTVVANVMAGFMLRGSSGFRPGDFIRCGDQFGRVTERGLFHTEIQTIDRDLTTIPNLYLVTNPVTVVRASGTIVSATVSLGYDVGHEVIEPLLLQAAAAAELEEPFVQILDLGDYSITYRIAGFLDEPRHLLTVRSNLRRAMLDALHGGGVEIVSPAFENQRHVPAGQRFIPRPALQSGMQAAAAPPSSPESIVFDKAERASRLEELRAKVEALAEEIEDLEAQLESADAAAKEELARELESRRTRSAMIEQTIKRLEAEEPPK